MAGVETKALETSLNTNVIWPPADGDLEALLRRSEIDPAARQ